MGRVWLRVGACLLATAGVTMAACASHSSSGGAPDAQVSTTLSCAGGGAGASTCGTASDSCCASPRVAGGTYFRSYDGALSTNGADKDATATLSDFSLDKYEVTVGRFRAFVAAEVAGWRPSAGSGKQATLPGGGLNDGKETGWQGSWDKTLATTQATWDADLACADGTATWTTAGGAGDKKPINCVTWYEAYAFCIWDGGFLPSEAEWNYAAAGGSDQRAYPWSEAFPPGSTTLDCEHAEYTGCAHPAALDVGSDSPVGDGKFGQADLAGNVFEWNLDWYAAAYPKACNDCAELTASQYRVIRGGAFEGASACLLNALRETSVPEGRSDSIGVRCARNP